MNIFFDRYWAGLTDGGPLVYFSAWLMVISLLMSTILAIREQLRLSRWLFFIGCMGLATILFCECLRNAPETPAPNTDLAEISLDPGLYTRHLRIVLRSVEALLAATSLGFVITLPKQVIQQMVRAKGNEKALGLVTSVLMIISVVLLETLRYYI